MNNLAVQTPKEPVLADLNALYETMSAQEILRHAIEEQFVDKVVAVFGSPKKATALAEDL